MQSAFGKKLFRLFLLFALIPSIFLAAVGYYLVLESNLLEQPGLSDEIHRYYVDLFTVQLTAAAESYDGKEIRPSAGLHHVIADSSDSVLSPSPAGTMLPQDNLRLVAAARARPTGFVQLDDRLTQYVSRPLPNNSLLVVAMVHAPAYTAMIDQYRAGLTAETTVQRLHGRYLFFLLLVILAVVLLSGALSYYLSGHIAGNLAGPISNLAEAADRIAEGDFATRLEPRGDGEVRHLTERFNAMAARLDTTTRKLAQTERVAAWRTIARRFAHELKNPLQPITVSLYQIRKGLADTPRAQHLDQPLQAVTEELRHLTDLAERFSSLAKLPEPNRQETDLNEVLRSVANLYNERLADYDFRLELPDEPTMILADETYFREVLHNILQNAIEASPFGAPIILSLAQTNAAAAISIADSGVGMSEEILKEARMPYFTTKESGSGIGLAVADKVISQLNGRLDIHSQPNEGTTVTIELPRLNRGASHA